MSTIAGMSTDRLKRIDALLDERYIQSGRYTGALTLVSRKGEVAHCSTQGLMDAARGKPMRENTIFRIYSMSKPITSVALMMLYEDGAFQLDDPVHKFIPAWERLGVWVAGAWPNFVTYSSSYWSLAPIGVLGGTGGQGPDGHGGAWTGY